MDKFRTLDEIEHFEEVELSRKKKQWSSQLRIKLDYTRSRSTLITSAQNATCPRKNIFCKIMLATQKERRLLSTVWKVTTARACKNRSCDRQPDAISFNLKRQ